MNSSTKSFQFPEVRVVEASAGSGKTLTLAKRYIQLLLHPDQSKQFSQQLLPIRHILAITFTNKAAFEMKARILEYLKKIALHQLSPLEEELFLEPIGLSAGKAAEKAFVLMDAMIHHYNFFQVQTIDKFINSLLSGCAFKINLTANFRIQTNSHEYLEYSLDELIDRSGGDKGLTRVFESFLHNYLYIENRTGWFPKQDMLVILKTLFQESNVYGCNFKESVYVPQDLIKKKRKILEDLRTLDSALPDGADKRFTVVLKKFLEKHTHGFDVDSLSDFLAREDIPLKKGVEVPSDLEKLWGKIRNNIKALCEEEAYSLFNPYVQIFNSVKSEFYELCAKDDVLFLEELNKKARSLFDDENITVEELYYRLATRFRHYLIDEFQDTSRLQWLNLEIMAEEALSTGGSLFYVGDRKQAIYGFRGGDVDLFDEIKKKFQAFNVRTEFLTNNFRSQKAIVEVNNAVFSIENLKRFLVQKQDYEESKNKDKPVVFSEADTEEMNNIFQGARQTFQPSRPLGYVKFERVEAEKKEERDEIIREKLIAIIGELKERFAYKDIAILTRSNGEVEQVTQWLLKEGILVESERTSDIRQNHLISELVAFLKFLDSPIDNLSFAQFILGDIFARATGKKSEEFHQFLFNLNKRLAKEKDLYVYIAFRDKYPALWQKYIEGFFKNVGLYPLYELVISLYHELGCLDHFKEYQGFLMHFLELIREQEEEHTDLSSFLEYFEELEGEDVYVHVTDSDTIKLLTIHKSKGLEFPVVILPFLGMDIQVGASGSDQKQSYILQRTDDAMGLLRLKSKYYQFSDDLYAIYAREYKKAFLSELNSVYVALTRPQFELYGFIPKRVGQSFNLAQLLITDDNLVRGEPAKYQELKLKESTHLKLPCPAYQDWIGYLKDEFPLETEFHFREERLKGEVIHRMLSTINNLKGQKIDDVVAKAVEEAKWAFPQITDFAEHQSRLKEICQSEKLRPFLEVNDGEVFTEKEIVLKNGHTKRLDRLIVKKSSIDIIDYKTSREPKGEQVKQVAEYIAIVKEIYPGKKVQGFLIYLDTLDAHNVNDNK